jgi:hypothetical protein
MALMAHMLIRQGWRAKPPGIWMAKWMVQSKT